MTYEEGYISTGLYTVSAYGTNGGYDTYYNMTDIEAVEITERSFCPLFLIAGIVHRVDGLGRIVIPNEIRRTLKIREGDPSLTTLHR